MSGIYLQGIEFPEKDYERIIIDIFPYGKVTITRDRKTKKTITALDVPDHGRLIDADAFIAKQTKQICENCDRRRGMKDGKLTKRFVYQIGDAPCRACDTGDMIEYVDDAPVVIPADKEEDDG